MNITSTLGLYCCTIVALMLCALQAAAQTYCPAAPQPNPSATTVLPLADGEILLSADSARTSPEDASIVELDGMISIRHGNSELRAESARYDTKTGVAKVSGDLALVSQGLSVHGADANITLDSGTFALGESGYEFTDGEIKSQGNAKRIHRTADGKLTLEEATYSSCPPGDNGWLIRTGELSLDQQNGLGTARDVSLRFKGVPIFYTPIFSFPIGDKRKTGFLLPRLDQTDRTGFEYRQPFYWNIAPNWDATFLGRAMTDRGFQLQTEVRHLNRYGNWKLNQEYIPNDNRFESSSSRHFTRLQQKGRLWRGWTTDMDFGSVSDREYFEDLGDTLKVASITHVQRRADLTYTQSNYQFRTRLLSYQTIDTNIDLASRPYQMMPQLTFNYKSPFKRLGLETSVDAELVYFNRDDSVTGSRLDFAPRAEWNVRRSGWFSTAAATWRFTRYDLNNTDGGLPQQKIRSVPLFSFDTGLYLEKVTDKVGSTITLEPRLFYLYSKRRDQSNLPVFDTGALDFNFSQLFRENRFSGADRINDANQVTVALSSRLIDGDSRREKMQGSIGQILYFSDRSVTLPGEQPDTDSSSDIVAEFNGAINRHWSAGGNLQWNPKINNTERASVQFNYRLSEQKLFNFGHRYLADDGEFLNTSFYWPLGNQWRLAAGWNYSLDEHKSIENVVGLEYESCCWAFRAAARQFITDDGEGQNTSYFFQLVLKGLAPVGQNVSEVLREGIGGYRNQID